MFVIIRKMGRGYQNYNECVGFGDSCTLYATVEEAERVAETLPDDCWVEEIKEIL